jgi:hypothetical protein
MIRFVRQGEVRATRERWILWGLVKIITHPLPLRLRDPASPEAAGTAEARTMARRQTRAPKRALPSGS